jgi:hypothetical protein
MVSIRQSTKLTIGVMLAASLVLGACSPGGEDAIPSESAVSEGQAQDTGPSDEPAANSDSPLTDASAPASASDGPLTATADSAISVQLGWEPVDGASSYDIEFSMSGEERLLLATLDASATSFEDIGVPEGVPLTYHLTPQGGGDTYSVTVATPSDLPNPYRVEPVLEAPTMTLPGVDLSGLDLENPDLSALDLSNFDPSMLDLPDLDGETFDPSALMPQAGTSATIGPDGGEIVTDSASGAKFTLILPPGALDEPTYIVMTPIQSLGNFPFSGGMTAAVQIEPEGIELNLPARLVIEGADESRVQPDGERLVDVAFAFGRGGNNFHLTPWLGAEQGFSSGGGARLARLAQRPSAAGPLAEIAAAQLESLGVGKATPAEVGEFAKRHPPSGAGRRARQKLAVGKVAVFPDDNAIEKPAPGVGSEEAPLGDLPGRRLELQAAGAQSCDEILAAFHDYEAYVNSGTVRQTSGRANNRILDALVSTARDILRAEEQRCLHPLACGMALAKILSEPKGTAQEQLAQAFGQKYPSISDTTLQDTQEIAKSCRMEMVIESTMILDVDNKGGTAMMVRSIVPLSWGFDPYAGSGGVGYLKGTGPVRYVAVTLDGKGCDVKVKSNTGESSTRFKAHRLDPIFTSAGDIEDFQLNDWSIPGVPNEMEITCPTGDGMNTIDSQLGGGTCDAFCFQFTAAHADSQQLIDWTMGDVGEDPGTIAIKSYERALPYPNGGTLFETTVLTIRRLTPSGK